MGKLFEQISQQDHILASYQLIREKWFDPALECYKQGATGIDGVDLKEFDRDLDESIGACRRFLLSPDADFLPQILTRVPKDEPGKFREIYLLTLRDKIVQRAIADPLAAFLERYMYPNLFSYRKGKHYGSIAAARKVRKLFEEHKNRLHVFKADIKSYFDSIDQELLLQKFQEVLNDEPEILRLLKNFVQQRRCDDGIFYSPIVGIPTGSSLSPVCANFYLKDLDQAMFREGYQYLRYGDDVLLLDTSPQRIKAGRALIEEILAAHKVRLSAKKTHLYRPGQSFNYLGYRFDGAKIHVGEISMGRFKSWVKETLPRERYQNFPNKTVEERRELLRQIVHDFNTGTAASLNLKQLPWIRGFPIVNQDECFREMDRYIKNRIRFVITRSHSKKNYRLVPNAWFQELGFKSFTGAYHRILRRRSLAPYQGWRRYFGTNFEAFIEKRQAKKTPLQKLSRNIEFVRKALNDGFSN